MQHNICRDYLAVELGGDTEWGDCHDRADVAVLSVPGEVQEIIEVKSARMAVSRLKDAKGQADEYREQLAGGVCKLRLHWLLSGNRLIRNKQIKKIERYRESFDRWNIELTTEPERPTPDHYEIAGVQFDLTAPNEAIKNHLAMIREDVAISGHLSEAHHNFLLELARAVYPGISRVTAEPIVIHRRAGMLVYGHGSASFPVDMTAARREWLKLTHHRWWSVPTLVGVSPMSTNVPTSVGAHQED